MMMQAVAWWCLAALFMPACDHDGGINPDAQDTGADGDADSDADSDTETGSDTETEVLMTPGDYGPPTAFEWVWLPGGKYWQGANYIDPYLGYSTSPKRGVTLQAFEIMSTQVTCSQYARCVLDGACDQPAVALGTTCNWLNGARDDHPVNCLNLYQAQAYCAWVGARLPSESEWEYAARSLGEEHDYAWGNEAPTCDHAVIKAGSGESCGVEHTAPVCSRPLGNTRQGLCDMGGNVWESLPDCWYGAYNGAPTDGSVWDTSPCTSRVFRGGDFQNSAVRLKARGYMNPKGSGSSHGFRCARDATSQQGTDPDPAPDPDPQCAGQPNFTPCDLVTVPDRSYDICAGGVCVSPGCGDASCNTPGPHFPAADTGQRLCYDAEAVMPCSTFPCTGDTSPDDYCGQDAQYGWDTMHEPDERFTRDLSTVGQPVVEDNVTGLVWQGCAAGLAGDDCGEGNPEPMDWASALAWCDDLSWAGHDDWRLPDDHESFSLLHFGKTDAPFVDEAAFPATPAARFWTSSTRAGWSAYAWSVDFGAVRAMSYDKGLLHHVRCIRGQPTPAAERFVRDTSVENQPVVTDSVTGLMWQGCIRGKTGDTCASGNWAEGPWSANLMRLCENLSWGGHADWRLPSATEVRSLVDTRLASPAIDADAFPGTPGDTTWTSTTHAAEPSRAIFVDFNHGSTYYLSKRNKRMQRCVRDLS